MATFFISHAATHTLTKPVSPAKSAPPIDLAGALGRKPLITLRGYLVPSGLSPRMWNSTPAGPEPGIQAVRSNEIRSKVNGFASGEIPKETKDPRAGERAALMPEVITAGPGGVATAPTERRTQSMEELDGKLKSW